MPYVLGELSATHRAYFESLKGITGHLREGIFIAEGPKIVEQILRSDVDVLYALMTSEFLEQFKELLENREGESTQIHLAPKSEMVSIIGHPLHQGVMIAARIPEQPPLLSLIESSQDSTFVLLEGIADAENMGTLIRTAAGLGATAVIVDRSCCHPFLRRSVRVSMGTLINLPIIQVEEIAQLIVQLKQASFFCVASALESTAIDVNDIKWSKRSAIILGAEGVGLTQKTLDRADAIARIPMHPGIDSLNVGVACGIFLHQRSSRSVLNGISS